MAWADLSNDAQGILEYLVGPYSGRRNEILLQTGQAPSIQPDRPRHLAGIVVDHGLLGEISRYLAVETDEVYEVKDITPSQIHLKMAGASDLVLACRAP